MFGLVSAFDCHLVLVSSSIAKAAVWVTVGITELVSLKNSKSSKSKEAAAAPLDDPLTL